MARLKLHRDLGCSSVHSSRSQTAIIKALETIKGLISQDKAQNVPKQNLRKRLIRFVLTNSNPVIGSKAQDYGAVAQLSECGLYSSIVHHRSRQQMTGRQKYITFFPLFHGLKMSMIMKQIQMVTLYYFFKCSIFKSSRIQ